MDLDFWLQRWSNQQIGFHLDHVNPNLEKYWCELEPKADSVVFVPLCGKSVDLLWLAQQVNRVIGIECSKLAINAFFNENNLAYKSSSYEHFNIHVSDQVSIVEGDIFHLEKQQLDQVSIVYDRAALVALPETMRKRYAHKISELTATGTRMLLVCLEYDQQIMQGPPFSVSNDEINRLYASTFKIKKLSSQNILKQEQRFKQKGLDSLIENVYLLERC